ncbi:MAG: hypothetical protein R6U58_15365 [Bacteroidales bacterium]
MSIPVPSLSQKTTELAATKTRLIPGIPLKAYEDNSAFKLFES